MNPGEEEEGGEELGGSEEELEEEVELPLKQGTIENGSFSPQRFHTCCIGGSLWTFVSLLQASSLTSR